MVSNRHLHSPLDLHSPSDLLKTHTSSLWTTRKEEGPSERSRSAPVRGVSPDPAPPSAGRGTAAVTKISSRVRTGTGLEQLDQVCHSCADVQAETAHQSVRASREGLQAGSLTLPQRGTVSHSRAWNKHSLDFHNSMRALQLLHITAPMLRISETRIGPGNTAAPTQPPIRSQFCVCACVWPDGRVSASDRQQDCFVSTLSRWLHGAGRTPGCPTAPSAVDRPMQGGLCFSPCGERAATCGQK